MEHQWPNFTSICQLVTAMVLSGEENKWLLIYWEAIRKIRSNPPQITHQVTIWMEGKNKQMYMETSEPSCLTRRSQRSWTLQGTKKLQVWGAQILPYHHWVVINQIRISLFLLKKKIILSHPKLKFLWTWHCTRHYTRTIKALPQFSFNCHDNSVYLDLNIILGCL